ncbi:hypothetical protein KPNJ1_04159 [Klebsiella pneumoniae 30660/NJST258_1]|nr:hypothetical protein KPNJ1_04159 [Klebsiella pneumoniae 30660/NJST258_1]
MGQPWLFRLLRFAGRFFLLLCLLFSIIARCGHFQHLIVITNDFNQTSGYPTLSDIAAYRNLSTNLQFLEIGTGEKVIANHFYQCHLPPLSCVRR